MGQRHGIVQLLCLTMVVGLLAGSSTSSLAMSASMLDNVTVVMDFYAAYNARDRNAAVALFAADAVVNRPPNPSATGKAEIAGWLQETWGRNVRLERPSAPQLAGDKVTVQSKISSDPLIGLGIAPLDQVDEFVVQNGMIKVYTYNLTAESINKITAAAGPPSCLPGSICPSGAPTNAPPGSALPPAGAPATGSAPSGAPPAGNVPVASAAPTALPVGNAPVASTVPTALPTTGDGFGAQSASLLLQLGAVFVLSGLTLACSWQWRRRAARRSR